MCTKYVILLLSVSAIVRAADPITVVATSIGGQATITCNLNGRNVSGVVWIRNKVGVLPSQIWSNLNLSSTYSGVYSVSYTSTSTTLTILSVNSTDLTYVFRCRDNAGGMDLLVTQLSTTSTPICNSTSSNAVTIVQGTAKSSLTLSCSISGYTASNISWSILRALDNSVQIWYNNALTSSSYSGNFSVTTTSTTSTLKILNASISDLYFCNDLSTAPIPSDLGIYAVCITAAKSSSNCMMQNSLLILSIVISFILP